MSTVSFIKFLVVILLVSSALARRPRVGRLIFEDNFSTINRGRWNFNIGRGPRNDGWGNGEKQVYTSRNARITKGKFLNIKCRKEGGTWTSARMTTKGKFEFTYGRVDVKVWTSRQHGAFPAVWMLSSKYGWPGGGEIDIFEMQTAWNYIPASLHFQDRNKGDSVSFKDYDTRTKRWRVYSVDWKPTYIAFYHDNKLINFYKKPAKANWNNWPFRAGNPFHLIINNAMHPDWGTAPAGSLTQHNLYVDYIRVWEF